MAASGSSPSSAKVLPSSSASQRKSSFPRPARIVVIEDNKADIFLLQEALAAYDILAELQVIRDGEEAIATIEKTSADPTGQLPDLFILDLNLPKRGGHEILAHIRQIASFGSIPVLVMTSSNSEKDRGESMRLGCNEYFRKPSEFDEFLKIGATIKKLLPAAS